MPTSRCARAIPTMANWSDGRSGIRSGLSTPASRSYFKRHGRPERLEDLPKHALVDFDDTIAKHQTAAWLQKVAPEVQLAARSNSVLGLVHAVKAGIGVGPLPIALGDAEPDLVPVLGPVSELTDSLADHT